MNKIIVKDNFLDKPTFNSIKYTLFDQGRGDVFPWFLHDSKVEKGDNTVQLTHTFYYNNTINSQYFHTLDPILKKLKVRALYGVKANVTMRAKKIILYKYHTDTEILKNEEIGKTGILYLYTTNGPTVFENGKKVDCVENRMLIFPANIKHTGSTHTDTLFRGVINFNWF
tara:strand:- start:104 stop:613 length:510 start_codon:yes stop_codon:yes gene_type:complete